jgi:hypothetical protein
MSDKTIKVRAGKGRQVHFPLRVIAAPGRRTLVLEGDAVVEIPCDMRFVRRSLRNGDLVMVQTEDAKPKAKPPTPKIKPKAETARDRSTDTEER